MEGQAVILFVMCPGLDRVFRPQRGGTLGPDGMPYAPCMSDHPHTNRPKRTGLVVTTQKSSIDRKKPSADTPDAAPAPEPEPGRMRRLVRRFDAMKHELAKFGVVGITAYALDSALFLALLLIIDKPLSAKILSGVVSGSAAFLGNRFWTWRHRPRSGLGREYLLYAVVSVVGLCIQLGALWFSHYALGAAWPRLFHSIAADLIAGNVVGMALATAFRFWAYRTVVFRDRGARLTQP